MDTKYNRAEAVTASDTVDHPNVIEAFIPGTTGNVALVLLNGDVVVIAVTVGTIYPVRARRINSTSTTSTGNVALTNGLPTIQAIGASG